VFILLVEFIHIELKCSQIARLAVPCTA
jgi:hypothetical protein